MGWPRRGWLAASGRTGPGLSMLTSATAAQNLLTQASAAPQKGRKTASCCVVAVHMSVGHRSPSHGWVGRPVQPGVVWFRPGIRCGYPVYGLWRCSLVWTAFWVPFTMGCDEGVVETGLGAPQSRLASGSPARVATSNLRSIHVGNPCSPCTCWFVLPPCIQDTWG